jgi:hypothetical protein
MTRGQTLRQDDRIVFTGRRDLSSMRAVHLSNGFVIDGEMLSLFDDAMISMRYARNLATGYGLVWNPGGERIEGYTNPLWVLYMSLIHLLPLPQSKTSLLVQVTAALLLAANLWFVRKIALSISDGSNSVSLGAVALTALYLPINHWSLQGMEVSVLVLITSACLWRALRCVDEMVLDVRLYLLLGLSTFIRQDMVVPLGNLFCFWRLPIGGTVGDT